MNLQNKTESQGRGGAQKINIKPWSVETRTGGSSRGEPRGKNGTERKTREMRDERR